MFGLQSFHHLCYTQDLFFFKSSSNNLQPNRKAIHHMRIVQVPVPTVEIISCNVIFYILLSNVARADVQVVSGGRFLTKPAKRDG